MTTSPPMTKQHTFTLTLRIFNNSRLIQDPHLHRLYFLGPLHPEIFDDQDFARFCQALSTLKSLSVLDINLSWTKRLQDRHFFELASALKRLQNLTVLRLNFRDSYHKYGHGIVSLFEALERHRSLKELYLDFSACAQPSPRLAELIYSSLRKMKNLESLHLIHFALPNAHGQYHPQLDLADEENLAQIFSKLKPPSHLKNLVLDYSKAQGLFSGHIRALSGVIGRIPRLSKVSLDFGNRLYFKKGHFETLAQALKNLAHLQSLHLALPYETTRGDSVNLLQVFSKALENFQTLSNLTLDFSKHNSLFPQHINYLFLALGTLTNISKLDLNFNSSSCFNSEVSKSFALSLENFKNLTSLKLNFLRVQYISGIDLATISDGLKDLSSLRELDLRFNVSYVHPGLSALFNALNSLAKQLSRLSLELSQSKEFGDKDLASLAHVLKGFNQLLFLNVNFFGTAIGDQGLHELGCEIQNLTKLEKFSGNFFGCKAITPKGVENFKNCIALNKMIQRLNLNFPENQGATQEEGKRAKNTNCCIF